MRYSLPTLTVYASKDREEYLFQRYMENAEFGYSQDTGDPIRLTRDQLLSSGAELATTLLAEYAEQTDLGPGILARLSHDEQRRFVATHVEIAVSLERSGMVRVCRIDLDPQGDTGQGREEEVQHLNVPITVTEFVAALDVISR